MKGKKKYIVVITVLVFVAMLYGYYFYNMPVPSISNQVPDYVLDPSELISDYELNEEEANQKYLDKIIQVEGRVGKVEAPKTLYIATDSPLSSVIVELEDSLSLASIKEGDTVILKGVCTGYLMDVVLNRAIRIDNK